MRDLLAERLLARVMGWQPEDVARERPDIEALATFKYDEYQQFSPGMRFIESLALWLAQFKSEDERKLAFEFLRQHLVFISNAEMAHLVSMTFADLICPFLISQTALRLGISGTLVAKIASSVEFQVLLRQSLFLGLSDGAHTDLFRRSNPHQISHEQVFQTYEIPETKAEDMLDKLGSDLRSLLGREATKDETKFRTLFLLDDFTGSGLSYLRRESNGSEYAGKVHKVLQSVSQHEGPLNKLVYSSDLHICIVLYVATSQALSYLDQLTNDWYKAHGVSRKCTIWAVQTLPDWIRVQSTTDDALPVLLRDYFDDSIINDSYRKGRHSKPYLGFDECALPLVLSHNTPNNSIPLLWFEEYGIHRGLFPRVSRHRI